MYCYTDRVNPLGHVPTAQGIPPYECSPFSTTSLPHNNTAPN